MRVRQFLGHTSGVSGWEKPITLDEVFDWELSTEKLASQAPWWEPGTQSGYHAMNQGHLVGEVVRRITGMKLGEFFRKEIAEPFDIDFHIGLSKDDFGRVATLTPPPPPSGELRALGREHPAIKTFTGPLILAKYAYMLEWRAADIPAANGHGNARSVAQAQSVISTMGKIGDTRVMSQRRLKKFLECRPTALTSCCNSCHIWAGVWATKRDNSISSRSPRLLLVWLWGSMIANDLDNEMTVAYVMNRMDEGLFGDVSRTLNCRCRPRRSRLIVRGS